MVQTVGIIGGGGWLGGAIVERGLAAEVLSAEAVIVSGRSPRGGKFAAWPELTWTSDNTDLAARSDIVILSVRPEDFGSLHLDLQGKLAISVMAGVSMQTLWRRLNTGRIIRTMPNAACEIGRSFTPWFATEHATTADRGFVEALFSTCGDQAEVATEAQLDYLSGLSGTGPAYPALLAKALLKHATERGLSEAVAMKAVRGVIASCSMMDNDAFDPKATVDTFLAYRGVTAAGLAKMEELGLVEVVGAGLEAAAQASAAMAGKYRI